MERISDITSATELSAMLPVIEVAFENNTWWSLPRDVSQNILELHSQGQDAIYTWDWEKNRPGSWMPEGPDGPHSTINRYRVDLINMLQTNIDNGRKRSVRVAWVRADHAEPRWTGQIPRDQTADQ